MGLSYPPPPSVELVLTFHSHTPPLPSLCLVESGTRVRSCPRSPLRGPSIAHPCPAIATDPFSLLSKNVFYCVYYDFIGRSFDWKDCFKDPLYTEYIFTVIFLQQSTILYFELIEIIFNRLAAAISHRVMYTRKLIPHSFFDQEVVFSSCVMSYRFW